MLLKVLLIVLGIWGISGEGVIPGVITNDMNELMVNQPSSGSGGGTVNSGMNKCEPLNDEILQLCSGIPYNETRFPNFMKHKTQQEAALETALYLPLVRLNCSPALKLFLCSLYAPPCVADYQQPLKPCRETCEKAKVGCEHFMKRFSFSWPDYIDCWRFPSVANEPCVTDGQISVTPMATTTALPPVKLEGSSFLSNLSPQQQQLLLASLTGTKSTLPSQQQQPTNPATNNNYFQQLYAAAIAAAIAATSNTLQMQTPAIPYVVSGNSMGTGIATTHRLKFTCPPVLQLQSPYQQASQYYLMVDDEMVTACGMPCDANLFTNPQVAFARSWVLVWAALCFFSTLFTCLTFAIEPSRFRYPERPIIFLSACYFMVAFAYLVGSAHLDSNSMVCKTHKNSVSLTSTRSYLLQGTDQAGCLLSFMCIYLFSMSAAMWWVVLTLTWFLAAGLKWGHEAIERIAYYFHVAAWGLPLVKLLAILWVQRVDADILAGVCFVGIRNMAMMRAFVLIPFLFYLGAGTLFLSLGFISLFRIRVVMKHEGNKTDKLEKFMVRIGVFSILYMVPAIIVICCLFYEQSMYPRWIDQWLKSNLIEFNLPPDYVSQTLDIGSSMTSATSDADRASSSFIFSLFMLKYAMVLVVGITSGFWIWSRKTVHSWRSFANRCLDFLPSFNMTYYAKKNEAQV